MLLSYLDEIFFLSITSFFLTCLNIPASEISTASPVLIGHAQGEGAIEDLSGRIVRLAASRLSLCRSLPGQSELMEVVQSELILG